MRLDLSPWARRQLPRSTLEQLRGAEPEDGRIHVGRGRDEWRALVTLRGHVLADERAGTPVAAIFRALRRLDGPGAAGEASQLPTSTPRPVRSSRPRERAEGVPIA